MGKRNLLTLFLIVAIVVGAAYYLNVVGTPNVAGTANVPIYKQIPLGLDLQGGVSVVLQGVPAPNAPVNDKSMEAAKNIIATRVNAMGVSEPVVQRKGADQIIVQLAGIKDPEEAIKAVGKTAVLEFRDPEGKLILDGKELESAQEQIRGTGGEGYVVALKFKSEGTKAFGEATTRLVGKPIGIYLDNDLIQNPVVQGPITGGAAEITGYRSLEDARRIAVILNSGSLPVNMKVIENRTVSATLGADSIAKSLKAGIIGTAAVLAFMLLNYQAPGLVANFALGLYILLNIIALWMIHAVLTLPGIAGLILSIGMAVDANVLIFERTREELRNGKTLRSGLEAGFHRAMAAVVDSNITTLIAGGVLYYFGSGPVRGFAVTLSLGVIISLFTAITVTQVLLKLIVNSGFVTKRFFGVGEKPNWIPNFDFMKTAKFWVVLSLIITVLGLGSLAFRGLNLHIDFTGGTILDVKFEGPVSIEKVREGLGAEHKDAEIQATSDRSFYIKTVPVSEEQRLELWKNLEAKAGKIASKSNEVVQPAISKELTRYALYALLLASLLQLIYITIRFEFKFAVTAIVALLHDALILIGIFSIFRWQVAGSFVAAALTVVGYSMHDTIIIFDRIRENLRLRKKETLTELVNNSINHTLTRTIKTVMTTLLALAAILIFGGYTIREFAIALTIGIVSGTYSSIFIASAIWLWWVEWERTKKRKAVVAKG